MIWLELQNWKMSLRTWGWAVLLSPRYRTDQRNEAIQVAERGGWGSDDGCWDNMTLWVNS